MKVPRLVGSLATVALVLTFIGAAIFPVSASAVSCIGHSCDGKNPVSTGCNQNAYLAKRFVIVEKSNGIALWQTYADVYYSRSCGTNWVRVSGNQYGGNTKKYIESFNSNGSVMYSMNEVDYGYGSSYSMMVYAPGSTKIVMISSLYDTSGRVRASTRPVALW